MATAPVTMRDVLIARLQEVGTSDALGLVKLGKNPEVSDHQFIALVREEFPQITQFDAVGAWNRSFALHAPRGGFSVPDNVYAGIFDKAAERGVRVGRVERAILAGVINPTEVLNA